MSTGNLTRWEISEEGHCLVEASEGSLVHYDPVFEEVEELRADICAPPSKTLRQCVREDRAIFVKLADDAAAERDAARATATRLNRLNQKLQSMGGTRQYVYDLKQQLRDALEAKDKAATLHAAVQRATEQELFITKNQVAEVRQASIDEINSLRVQLAREQAKNKETQVL